MTYSRVFEFQPDNLISRAASAARPSPPAQDDIPDLAALREIARQQEEALRQAVEQQQHGYVERKHSWQNDALSKSAHSSAGSLVSSKSVDVLHKTNANPSRIPAPTRLPRKTGIPAPAKRDRATQTELELLYAVLRPSHSLPTMTSASEDSVAFKSLVMSFSSMSFPRNGGNTS
ncbi:unnamed protein product [Cylicostephanus goldi]|uniref:Uncharacterized protein n=1 Tax=Cylicostephanus goldi TaxID=71465 RepID=A0A3P6QYX6_CYLGO|nr:unnamed protein product [Cylicostephanus goldi]